MKNRRMLHSTFLKWLVPYIAVVLIPIGFGVLLYYQALQTVEQNVELLQGQELPRLGGQMDDMANALEILGYSISNNIETAALREARQGRYSLRQIESSKKLQNALKTWGAANKTVNEISVYFPKTGYLLTEVRFCPASWSDNPMMNSSQIDFAHLCEEASDIERGFLLADSSYGDLLLYAYPFRLAWAGQTQSVIFFTLDKEYVQSLLDAPNSIVYLSLGEGGSWLKPGWSAEKIASDPITITAQIKSMLLTLG